MQPRVVKSNMHATRILVYMHASKKASGIKGVYSGVHLSLESGQSSLIIHIVKCIVIVKLKKWYIYGCYKRVNILRERDIYIYTLMIFMLMIKYVFITIKKIGILIGAHIIEWVF